MSEARARRVLRVTRYELIGLATFFLAAGGLVTATALLHHEDGAHRISMAMEDEAHAAAMRHDVLSAAIGSAVSDILFLSDLNEVAAFRADSSESGSEALARELVSFTRTRSIYDQIRILSSEGMELVRVDRRDGSPRVAASSELQDETDREYFQKMRANRSDPVYVSSLAPDIENGIIESPLKPVLRFGIGLGSAENPQAYFVVDMLGSALLDAYEAAHPNTFSEAYLLDSDGYWIRGPERELEWGSILQGRNSDSFRLMYPEEWRRFVSERDGQFETNLGLFTFDTVVPAALASGFATDLGVVRPSEDGAGAPASPAGVWITVSVVSPETLRALRGAGVSQLVGWNVVGLILIGAGSSVLARRLKCRAEFLEHTRQEKETLASTLEKYMHKEIRDRVLADPSRHARLGGEAQDVVVLFADIRGFTRFTERNDPEYVVSVLNRTFTELSVPLRVFDGILDKYIGDGFLAFFEAKPGSDTAAQRAVEAACMMQKAFRNLWRDAASSDLRELGLGIGVSAGRVVVGNIGSEGSMDYTVVGDAVNVASRLEGMARRGEVLLCGAVQSQLRTDLSSELVHRAGRVRGRGKALEIYRLS